MNKTNFVNSTFEVRERDRPTGTEANRQTGTETNRDRHIGIETNSD